VTQSDLRQDVKLTVPAPTKNFCKGIAPFAQILMLKPSPDRFGFKPSVRENLAGCGFDFLGVGVYVTLFVALAGSLKRQHASQAAGFAAVTIAAAALIGWWAGLPLLSSWGSGFPTMKPVTALCLAALGLAVVHPGKNLHFVIAVGLGVGAVAALDLFGVDFGINRWLVPQAAVPGPAGPSFRMINGMPLAIALAGGSLALGSFERHQFAATALGGLAGVMAVFALLTYLTGIHALYSSVPPPALPTAVGPALRRRRDRFTDRTDAHATQIPAVVAPAGHARMRDHSAAPAVRRVHGISHHRRANPPRSE
jgi:hypothetical protein